MYHPMKKLSPYLNDLLTALIIVLGVALVAWRVAEYFL